MTTLTASTSRAPFRPKPGERVCVVAGSGRLPVDVAATLAANGHAPFVFLIEGEADPDGPLTAYAHEAGSLADTSGFLRVMKREQITHVVLAGAISRRPRFREIRIGLPLVPHVPKIALALARGDDGLLRVIIALFEKLGMKIVGAHQVAPDLLVPCGVLTRAKPTAQDRRDLDAALAAAHAIGALDIGQGAVSIGGRVIALEGIEGTDGLLRRTADLRGHGRLAGKQRGVLVKCAKRQQEMRADLPSIGPETVEAAHRAGLVGIGVEAERSLMLDAGALIERADALGLFVVGLEPAVEP